MIRAISLNAWRIGTQRWIRGKRTVGFKFLGHGTQQKTPVLVDFCTKRQAAAGIERIVKVTFHQCCVISSTEIYLRVRIVWIKWNTRAGVCHFFWHAIDIGG